MARRIDSEFAHGGERRNTRRPQRRKHGGDRSHQRPDDDGNDRSSRCHDESTGSLRIRYAAAAPGAARHGWTFVWNQTDWSQDTPESKASHETSTIPIPPGGAFDTANGGFPYCDGGLME